MLPLVLSSSCSLTMRPHEPRSMAYSSKELAVKPNQIRLSMRALVEPFSGEIEHSADEIATGTSDISVKRAAIQWKIDGVPALRTALFQPNPFTAVLDTWVLMYQMANYFESGPGSAEFGPAATRAVDTCLKMEDELNRDRDDFHRLPQRHKGSGCSQKVGDGSSDSLRHPRQRDDPGPCNAAEHRT
jgi:hypothetical protein